MNRPTRDITCNDARAPRPTPTDERPGSSDCDLRPAASPIERLGVDLAREMRRRWRAGERPAVEEFLSRHPELSQHAEATIDLIYEEYCLRRAAERPETVEQDVLRRFPRWAAPLRVMLECHRRLLQSERDRPDFPASGDRLADFKLLADLARGSRGRVFLAAQTGLADRPVVLKVTPLDGAEHLSLARLQHGNIVPLYSVIDNPARNIRVLCMPYFGRATLASLLESLAGVPPDTRTGQHVVAEIERLQDPSFASLPATAGAPWQMLARVSYAHAISWIVACLADALQFAHERGVVHLDLKPSNVLLAADGQPMLLDFHLAREPIRAGGPLPGNFGGTFPYMPPEQRAAMRRLEDGGPADVAVDGRADIHALGAVLYESLGGRLPITSDSPPLARVNRQVSRGLSDIVARCVASRPEDRYPDALALAEDLRRHLTDQPLVGVPNRSIAERWSKWRRRRPGALRAAGALLLVCGAAAILLAGAASSMRDRRQLAELALRDGQRQLQRADDPAEAVQTLQRGLTLAQDLPFQHRLRQELRDQLMAARRLHLAHQLHRLSDEVRVLYGAESIPPGRLRSLAARAREIWDKRGAIVDALASASDNPRLIDDLQDIAICLANLQARLSRDAAAADRREALRVLDEAVAMFGPSAVLDYERHRLSVAISDAPAAASASRPTDRPAPSTAWAHYALGRALLVAGDLSTAAGELSEALQLEPAGRWPNFYAGLCAHRTGRHQDAVAAFSVCIGADPAVAGYFYNRALAYAAMGRPEHALRDYGRALRIDPAHAPAALNRGVLQFQQGRHERAIADLAAALEHGADADVVHFDLALVHNALNDPVQALRHARLALEQNPAHEAARRLRDTLQRSAPAN